MLRVIFTDLDGTLLDHDTYSWDAARDTLHELRRQGVPVILVTSKTRAEVEALRRALGNTHPFIVENGGAAFIPRGYFPFDLAVAAERDHCQVIEWGKPYPYLVAALQVASAHSGCPVRGFHDMTVTEVAAKTGMPLDAARLAKIREYGEPFLVEEQSRLPELLGEIESLGLRWTRGGRFHHIMGGNDKALAVQALARLYRGNYGPVRTIGLGDGLNDAAFLRVVDDPVIIPGRFTAALRLEAPRARVERAPGPAGWSAEVAALAG